MIVNTEKTIAYKCTSCGSFKFISINLFKLLKSKNINIFKCDCNKSSIKIQKCTSSDSKITIPCIGCGNEHIFIIRWKEIIYSKLYIFDCCSTGIEQCFIGNDKEVRKKIDDLEENEDLLMNRLGYDNYFKNTRVMIDSLNKVHDIAEQGNIYCECGERDVELILSYDRIYLRCKKCDGYKVINASNNEDLKYTLNHSDILLISGYQYIK